ncbi:hypothetical protein AAMO2058_000368900 [Amorphochlora amoebiformis]
MPGKRVLRRPTPGPAAHEKAKRARLSLEENEEYTPDGNIVFQCKNCRTIISDSNYIETMDEKWNIIAFNGTRFTEQVEKLLICNKPDQMDYGCTYNDFVCTSCKKKLGKVYKTTVDGLDVLRDMYTVDIKTISSYELNSIESENKSRAMDAFLQLRVRQTQILQTIQQIDKRFKAFEEDNQPANDLVKFVGQLHRRLLKLEEAPNREITQTFEELKGEEGETCRQEGEIDSENSIPNEL